MAPSTKPEKNIKTQPSRKGKKAWRKNIDITGVEDSLESIRSEERVRGKVTPVEDRDLFTIDTVGDNKVKRQLAKDKVLRVDEILAQRSAVSSLSGRSQAAKKDTNKKPSKYTYEKATKIAKRPLEQEKSSASIKKNKTTATSTYDLWGQEEEEEQIVKVHKKKAPVTMNHIPLASLHRTKVVVPHAGASYNPSMEEHQQLMKTAHLVEVEKVEKLRKIEEQLSYRKELDALAHELDEHNAHIKATVKEEEEEEEQILEAKKQQESRKTRSERNKEKRAKLEQLKRDQKASERSLWKQIDGVEKIKEELSQRNTTLQQLAEKRETAKEAADKEGLKRVGKHYVQEAPIEIQLQDELSETLRQLKPEGNIFRDRFVSLQKRNIIEPRVPVKPHTRYRAKVYEHRAYKNFDAAQAKLYESTDKK